MQKQSSYSFGMCTQKIIFQSLSSDPELNGISQDPDLRNAGNAAPDELKLLFWPHQAPAKTRRTAFARCAEAGLVLSLAGIA